LGPSRSTDAGGGMNKYNLKCLFAGEVSDDPDVREKLFAALYGELRRMTEHHLRRAGGCLTLSPTTLLHETYLDLIERSSLSFPDRRRFMAYASRAMRGLVIDYVRSRRARKRGGSYEFTSLPTHIPDSDPANDHLLRLNEAVDELENADPELARLVELKFFCGYSLSELAELRGVSERTLQREWDKARIFLFEELREALVREPRANSGIES
jgi:RNA polymerase sigma factor (TIGR02999 family)